MLYVRMSVESQENRTVEVLGVPEEVEDELLYLYFENKRRSGGGSLVSVELEGSRAILVFEEADGKNIFSLCNPCNLISC